MLQDLLKNKIQEFWKIVAYLPRFGVFFEKMGFHVLISITFALVSQEQVPSISPFGVHLIDEMLTKASNLSYIFQKDKGNCYMSAVPFRNLLLYWELVDRKFEFFRHRLRPQPNFHHLGINRWFSLLQRAVKL